MKTLRDFPPDCSSVSHKSSPKPWCPSEVWPNKSGMRWKRICSFFLGRYRKRMACNKRMNVANSLSDVRCSIMAHYVLFSETISSTLKCSQKLCVIAHFIHLGLRYSYYLSDIYVKAKHRFDCSFWLQSNGSGGCTAFFAEHVLSNEFS